MADGTPTAAFLSLPQILHDAAKDEVALHREFLFRNIDFLIDVFTGEQSQKHWYRPAGCPSATPEALARRRSNGEKYPCRYEALTTTNGSSAPGAKCGCGDQLAGSNAILDSVVAVAIAPDDRTPGQRYFDQEERQLIARLRQSAGSWDEISKLDRSTLEAELTAATNREGVSEHRIRRIVDLLETVENSDKTDGVSLSGLRGTSYNSLCEFLSELPGISRSDAWWLLLVAFDKPVWPVDPYVGRLLCSLGLLDVGDYETTSERRQELESELVDRHIGVLHRALAGHALKGAADACGEDCEVRKFLLTHRLRKQAEKQEGPVVVDLFSGAGGISLGFSRAGCSIEWAIDKNQHATDTYRLNHPEIPHRNIVCDDIRDAIDEGAIESLARTPDILVGGPPCQSLSLAGYRSRRANDEDYSVLDDDRTSLYTQYVRFVEDLRPKAIVIENVEGMFNELEDTGIKVGDLVLEAIESIGETGEGYRCDYRLIDCSEIGIPQDRQRVIILGIREDVIGQKTEIGSLFDQLLACEVGPYTLQHGLSGLPRLRRGEGGAVVTGTPTGKRSEYVRSSDLASGTTLHFNHQAREHPMSKDQTLFDEALNPGDTGWDIKYGKDGKYSHLIEYDVGTEENPRFKDKYRMLDWQEPSPTIVAHLAKDANSFVLPDYHEYVPDTAGEPDNRRNRGITPREAARIQSFPDDYVFLGPFTSWFRQIGNAIPPLLGERLAEVVCEVIEEMNQTTESVQQFQRADTDD